MTFKVLAAEIRQEKKCIQIEKEEVKLYLQIMMIKP